MGVDEFLKEAVILKDFSQAEMGWEFKVFVYQRTRHLLFNLHNLLRKLHDQKVDILSDGPHEANLKTN